MITKELSSFESIGNCLPLRRKAVQGRIFCGRKRLLTKMQFGKGLSLQNHRSLETVQWAEYEFYSLLWAASFPHPQNSHVEDLLPVLQKVTVFRYKDFKEMNKLNSGCLGSPNPIWQHPNEKGKFGHTKGYRDKCKKIPETAM